MTQIKDPRKTARVAQLEAALREIADIAAMSEGPAAKFYGMLAEKALENNSKKVE